MSTRSTIIVKLNPADRFATKLKVNKDFALSHCLTEETIDKMSLVSIKPYTQYLGIYCHHDGYPEYLGNMLTKHYNTYDLALNLVLCGDTSTIDKNFTETYLLRGEQWDHLAPKQMEKPRVVTSDAEYIYVFENGRWKFSSVDWEDTTNFIWRDVLKYLDSEADEIFE